jgi:DNA-binding GntR family transcriptional regulator
MAQGVMHRIAELSEERERLLAREGSHRASGQDQERLRQIDHELQVLWDLRRRELAGEPVNLDDDYLDRYTVDPGSDAPGR